MLNLAALREYACVRSPSVQIPPSTLLTHNDQCIAIFDAFPKAKYHFLILPRFPFPAASESGNSDDREPSSFTYKLGDLDNLSGVLLRTGKARDKIVDGMISLAKEVEEMIQDEMMKTEGFVWGVDMGYHAVPSMRHIHLHVISDDRISSSLKTKKHYNSFRPDLGFLVHPEVVKEAIEHGQDSVRKLVNVSQIPVEELPGRHGLLDEPLTCVKCGETFNQMPKLKAHLVEEWEKARRKATKTKTKK